MVNFSSYNNQPKMLSDGRNFNIDSKEAEEYISQKIDELIAVHRKSEERSKKIEILEEVWNIIDNAVAHGSFPRAFGYFKTEKQREEFEQQHFKMNAVSYYFGNIFSNYHQRIFENHLPFCIINGTFNNNIIRFHELYNRSLNDYAAALLHIPAYNPLNLPIDKPCYMVGNLIMGEHAYATSFIVPALIERFLIIQLSSKILHESINVLSNLLDKGKIYLSKEEMWYYETFSKRESQTFDRDLRPDLYTLFIKYHVLEESDDIKQIFLNHLTTQVKKKKMKFEELTLGGLFYSEYVKKQIEPNYYRLLKFLFHAKDMNVRNHIMHANNEFFDYFGIGITSIMVQLLWDILSEDIFKC
ncbi:MAG: hypothetical protein IJ215_05225 [Clostridia bacterium]|nr:hypothetical protein [Clostridia bacterium]